MTFCMIYKYLGIALFCKKCFDCELPMDSPQLTHKIPLHRGGTNDMSNLKAVCETCNFRTEIQNSYL